MDISKFHKLILDDRSADHIIYNYINENDIKYTKNNNGIFFNLNCLNETQTNELYKLINDYIENIDTYDKKICNIKAIVKNTNIKKKEEKIYDKIDMDKFTKYENKIINLSRIF
tara:strand:+ start:573 stop:914 length:342 start_codon:yes stop_codon:yes gene_type:complete